MEKLVGKFEKDLFKEQGKVCERARAVCGFIECASVISADEQSRLTGKGVKKKIKAEIELPEFLPFPFFNTTSLELKTLKRRS